MLRKNFDYFVKKIPTNIHNNTKSIIGKNIAIFIPDAFVMNKKLIVEEYHFVICFTTPPPATIKSKIYHFKKGNLICLSPGDDLLVHTSNKLSTPKYMAICVNVEFMQNVYQKTGGYGSLKFKRFDNTYSYQLLEAIEALIYEVLNYNENNHFMVESLENRITVQLLRDSSTDFNVIGINNDVHRAKKYIETYYSSNITVKDICNAIYISPSHLQKIFLEQTGKTPYQYIMECRHNKAKEMLETSNFSVQEIARQCGFVNSAHFSTVFKQKEGMSPLVYKKGSIKSITPQL